MRYAIFSDVHANLRAWESVLADIREQEVDVLVCLGDVVGYGPKPVEVLEAIRAVTSNFVMGNHDAAAIGAMDYSVFNDHARHSVEWTANELTDEAREFLGTMPIAIEADDLFFVHAEICEPGRFDYITDPGVAEVNFAAAGHFVTFVGHTHHPKVFELTKKGRVVEHRDENTTLKPASRYIVNVGSVGEPRTTGDLRARYVIYDSAKRKVDFRAVRFDIPAYRRDLDGTKLKVTPFFLNVFEQETGMLEVDWMAETGVAPVAGGDWIDASSPTATIQLQEDEEHSNRKSVWAHQVLPIAAALMVVAIPFGWAIHRLSERVEEPARGVATAPAGGEGPVELPDDADQGVPVTPAPGGGGEMVVDPTEPVTGLVILEEPLDPGVPAMIAAVEDPLPGIDDEPLAVVEPPPAPMPAEPEAVPIPEVDPVPEPEPVKPVPSSDPVVAWWRMDEVDGGLPDAKGNHPLVTELAGAKIKAIAPEELPVSGVPNPGALQLGVWSEAAPSGEFALRADRSFTLEAWLLCDTVKRPVFVAGTRSGEANGQQGWHIDLRPPYGNERRRRMSFFWDSGSKMIQALSEDVPVMNRRPHHVAAVWDHAFSKDVGEMRLYLDGELVASAGVHHSLIKGTQANPFRIGAPENPQRIGMDEARFSHVALHPLDFLLADPLTITKSGRWADGENWSAGEPPSDHQVAVIGPGVRAEYQSGDPGFAGDLILREGAELSISSKVEDVDVPGSATLTLEKGSRLVVLAKGGRERPFGPIQLAGPAEIWGGRSMSGHHTGLEFAGEVSGDHPLALVGVNNNRFRLMAGNTFSGGLLAESRQDQGFRVEAEAPGSCGTGDVHIGGFASLIVGAEDAIDDRRDLFLTGPMDARVKAKLVLNAKETVRGLHIDGVRQKSGTWGRPGSKADHESKLIAGDRLLTVLE